MTFKSADSRSLLAKATEHRLETDLVCVGDVRLRVLPCGKEMERTERGHVRKGNGMVTLS